MQHCRSPTPDAVINEVINEICSLWNIQHVQQALPNGLSYRHTPDIEKWGEEFLVLLLDLAKLTKGKLDEVKKRIQKRIDQGRSTKLSRDTCTTREDILALIRYYAQQEPDEDADEDTAEDVDEDADEDPDEDYIPPVPKRERRYNP